DPRIHALFGFPAERDYLHEYLSALGGERDRFEVAGFSVVARRDAGGLFGDLGVELFERLLREGDFLLRTADVSALLVGPAGAAGGRRRFAERARADRLAAEQGAEYRRAERDRRLHLGLRRLIGLAVHAVLGPPHRRFEPRAFLGELPADDVDGRVARLALRVLHTDAEVVLGLAGIRGELQ